jgi:ubiquinone/menaquinone biosynthesis C-methylase UbiE
MRRWRETWARFQGRGVYPAELAWLLRLPLRDLVFSRRRLVEALAVRPDAVALEIGPGPGFFSPAVAEALPEGRLELLDVQREMLRKARRRVRRAKLPNVHYTCGRADRLPYRSGAFDAVFLVAVLGEVSSPDGCIGEVARVLRPSGRLCVAELPGDPDALSRSDVETLAKAHRLDRTGYDPLRGGFCLTLEPAR